MDDKEMELNDTLDRCTQKAAKLQQRLQAAEAVCEAAHKWKLFRTGMRNEDELFNAVIVWERLRAGGGA